MSLNQRFPNPIIIADHLPDDDAAILLDETGSTTADGWDNVNRKYAILGEQKLTIENVSTLFPVGQQLDLRSLYAQSVTNFKCHGQYLYTFDVNFMGLASVKPVVVDYDGAADQQQGTNIGTPDGVFESVATHENSPTASVRYVVTDITTAPTDEVGRAKVPPSAPAVSGSVWSSLTKFTYHYPNGWVLMASKTTRLAGTSLAFIDDRYQYIRDLTPRT